jgi:hypothetical protein
VGPLFGQRFGACGEQGQGRRKDREGEFHFHT